jgi:DNA-binding IclR family transcriptional regulator
MMAYQDEDRLAEMLRRTPLPAGADETRLRADLADIRKRGHEVVDSFVVKGVVNISVPIIDHSGHAVAALTVPHIERFGESVSLADCCVQAIGIADKLTRRLGGGAVDRGYDRSSETAGVSSAVKQASTRAIVS